MQDNADPVLLGDHDVALASIEKVVVGESNVCNTVSIHTINGYLFTKLMSPLPISDPDG